MRTDTAPPLRQREPLADLLKGIAILLMIQVHVVELFSTQEVFGSNTGRVALFLGGPPAAPVFMAVMGYFLAASRRGTRFLVVRGLKLFVGGLLLNVGLNMNLLVSIAQGRFDLNPYQYIFGADILTFAGLSVMIVTLIRTTFKQSAPLFVLLAFVVASLGNLPVFGTPERPLLMYINAFFWGDFSWSYFPLFPWLAYPLIGYALRLLVRRLPAITMPPAPIASATILVLAIGLSTTGDFALRIVSSLPDYYHHRIDFFAWTGSFLIGWTLLFLMIESRIGSTLPLRYLKWLGRNVTSAFVFQWLLIGNIATAIYKTQSPGASAAWFLVITALVSLLVLAWTALLSRFRKPTSPAPSVSSV